MKLTSNHNTLAWKIRKETAIKYNCNVMDIPWKDCLEMARERIERRLSQDKVRTQEKNNKVISKSLFTAFALILCYMAYILSMVSSYQPINETVLKYGSLCLFSSVCICLLITISTMVYNKNYLR